MEVINLLAIILGPILAVQIQKLLERQKEEKQRKLDVFKTLMATRGNVLSHYHVEALNRIDLEFSGNDKYEAVISAWKEYFDNLSIKLETNEQIAVWTNNNVELLANLLFEMGKVLGYNFDRALIKRNWYSPVAHAKIEKEQELIRNGILDLLNGEFPLQMQIVADEDVMKNQAELNDLLMRYYQKKLEDNQKTF